MPTLTVAQNIFLNQRDKICLAGFIDDQGRRGRARALCSRRSASTSTPQRRSQFPFSAGQRQLTEIVKSISQDVQGADSRRADHGAVGGRGEQAVRFPSRQLKSEGVAIIYVSHRMEEITRIADRATILRDGRHVVTAPLCELTLRRRSSSISSGRRSRGFSDVERAQAARGKPLLELRDLSGPRKPENLDLMLFAGRSSGSPACWEAAAARWRGSLFGIDPMREGEILVRGAPAAINSPIDAIAHGLALVPEDRLRQGLILDHSVEFERLPAHSRPSRLVDVPVRDPVARSGGPTDRRAPD